MRHSIPLLAALALAATMTAQQQLLVPFNHHLGAAAGHSIGSTSIFRTTGGRFAVIFEASNFLASGVTGPIVINKLRFRGEDTETNRGGQFYSNVTVRVGTTSISTTNGFTGVWANNWAPTLPLTTSGGTPLSIPTLNVAPSLGTSPNNYHIEIDLAALGGSITYDPSSAEPNLLVEVIMPSTPGFTFGTALGLIPTQQTAGTAAQLGSSCRTSADATGATAGATVNGPVMNIEFQGAGGYTTLTPARVENFGAACGGSPSGFYQLWQHSQAFDLANTTLVMTPDNVSAPNIYSVTASTTPPDLTKLNATPNNTGDDQFVTHALGYTFAYPGNSTTQLVVSNNGYFFLDGGNVGTQSWVPTREKWLGTNILETARFAPIWHDWHCGRNAVTHPNSGLHVLNDTLGGPGQTVTYLTWYNVARANTNNAFTNAGGNGASVNTFQAVLYEATGVVEFRYGAMSAVEGANQSGASLANVGITGFTRGNIAGLPSVDPQSRDLSHELPFTTLIEGTTSNIGLEAVQAATVPTGLPGRLFAGQSVTWNATNVPIGAVIGVQLLDFASFRPGLQFPGITAPGCMYSLTSTALAWEAFVLPTSTTVGTVPLVVPAGYDPTLIGFELFAQFLVLDGLIAGPDLITSASHGMKHTIGLQ